MRKTISILAASLLLSAGAAWAQTPGAAVAPIAAPQGTGATVQGTSEAATTATQGTPEQSKTDKKDEKKTEGTGK